MPSLSSPPRIRRRRSPPQHGVGREPAPVLGPRTLEQLTGSFPALDVTIDEQVDRALDDLIPGPGGEAPDAYTGS